MNASIGVLNGVSGTISDGTSCGGSSYEDMTSLSCSLQAGASYVPTLSLSCSYYSSFSVQVWIDYNDDGTFASTESVGGGGSFSSCTSSTITLTIPSTATVGPHRMRMVNNYQCCGGAAYPSINPCPTTSISYGDARDYMVNIVPPPPAATLAPTTVAFSPTTVGSSSSTSNIILNASYLVGTSGNLTVTSSNTNFEVFNGSSWVSSYTISYSGATVSAATIPVRFTPAAATSYSGTICVTGGSLASAVCASVTGTGASICSGTPTAGTASCSPSTGSTGTTFTLTCSGYTVSGGISFQWQSASSSGGTYTNISGATLSSYSFSGLSATTYYKCIVTCSASGLSATTAFTSATWVLPSSSCTPAFANACSSYPMTTSIRSLIGGSGSISDATACTGSSYEDYSSSMGCTLFRSLTYGITMNTSTTYFSSFNTQFWIDFNDNGTFESSESMCGTGYVSSATPSTTLTIPASAAIGMHRARVVGNYECCGASTYPSINPCPTSSISYGDCRDYYIIIQDPPPYGTTAPASLNFGTIATSTTSSALASVITGNYLTPASSNLTVTAPSNYEVSSTAGGTYAPSYTISYSGATVAATSVWVRFVGPATPGSYCGNVAVTGGGLASALNIAVCGISANACSGTPSGGTAVISSAAGTSSTTFNLSLSGATIVGLGLSYQWQSATSAGGTYTNITGATNTTYSVSGLTSARFFRCVVSCSYSSSSATSSNIGCAIYCLPTFAQPCSSYPMNASIGSLIGYSGSISDASTCGSTSYEDMTSLSCTLRAGSNYTTTLNLSCTYYGTFSLQVWIDYNDDGTFASTESVGGGGGFTSCTGSTIVLAIPASATVGTHRMRLVNNYQCCGNGTYPTINPCPTTSISYGDARDYTVGIAPPPAAATLTPSSIPFSPALVGTPSAASNLILNASYLTPTASSLTVTSSNSNFEVYDGSSWVGSYTIAYTAATVTANTVQVRFNPGSTGSFTGTICVTGGGLASAVCSSVSGTGATACSGTPTAGTGTVSPTTGSGGTSFTLTCSGYTASAGVSFQWESRNPSGSGSFTAISGATLASYSFTGISSSTDYRCVVTCSYSGLSSTTSPVTATWVLPPSSCTPTFGSPCSSYPMTTSIKSLIGGSGSITDNNACVSSSYIDYSSSMTCTLYRALTYNATLNVSTSYYSSFSYQVWIDFNDNGTFESTESIGGGNNPTSPTPVVALAIPASAPLGMHRTRIVGNYGCCGYSAYPSINPCPTSSISYGDCRDYSVTIQNPPPMGTVAPTSMNFGTIAASSSSSAQSAVYTGSFLTPASDALTVTAPANYSVCSTAGGTYVPSYTVSYSSSTVAATSTFVKFDAPSTVGTYTGNVTISGGGLSSALSIAVTGNGATACSGTPTAGTSVATPSAGTSTTSFTLSLSGSSLGLGLTYQWMQSTTGTSGWTNITGATNSSYTFSGLTSSMYYYCLVTCTYSSLNQFSSVVRISNYCVPTFANACSSFPMNASIGTLNGYAGSISDASGCGSTSYEDMTSLSCSLQAGATYTPTLNLSCSYYPSFSVQVWIDYNDDGTFASTESIGGGGSFSSCTGSTISLVIPSTAALGVHRMRFVNNYQCCGGAAYPSINPCPTTSISYGDARDYMVNIVPPPPSATLAPTSIAFSPTTTGTSSTASNLILNASFLTPASGSVTVTSSNAAFEVYNGSSWVSSYTISYTTATVSAATIPVRFSPGSAGSFSGTICVTGGGLASAVCASVNGTGASPCSGTPTAGTASVSPTTGATATTFTLSVTGFTSAGGMQFQWQSRNPSGSGSFTNIAGATLSTYSFSGMSSTTDYQCVVTCSYSGSSATTSPVTATWVLPSSSCTPTFGSASLACSSYAMYAQFAVNGTSGSIADASACSGSGWEDLTASTSVTLLRGNTFVSTITTGGSYYSSMTSEVWIDYNDNGTFATSESVGGYNYFTSTNQPVTLTIPSGATPGTHRMRVAVNYACCGFGTYPGLNPCPTTAIAYGDVRDYKVIIVAPVACSGTPSAGSIAASPTTGCSPVSTSMSLPAAAGVTGLTYQWQSSSTGSGGSYSSISGATGATYSPSVATNTYYQCVLTCTASGGSATTSAQLITANAPGGAFSGTANACAGSSSTLTNAVTGGTWSSSNTSIATVVPSTGVVYGVAPGSCSINYTTTGCGAVSTSWTTNANPGTTSGTLSACVGGTRTLTNTIGGGTWSSSDTTVATVSGSGASCVVTATGAGSCTITYSTGCGTPTTSSWTTNTTPSAIIGLASCCTASTTTMSNTVGGGTWTISGSSTGTTIDATTGVVYTSTTVGTETVTYTIGSCFVTASLGVGSTSPGSITGASSVCSGSTTTLSCASAGGAWTSSNPSVASIGFSSGVVNGVTSGTVTITYSTGCGSPSTTSFTVNGSPVTISSATACSGSTLSMTATTTGGGSYTYSWSGPSGFTSTSASPSISSAATTHSGIYSVSVTQSGCTSSTSYWVRVNPTPTVTVTAAPASICPGGSSNLNVSVTSPASGTSNYTVMAIPYSPLTITSPTSGPSGDDNASTVSLPFSFNYYGTSYSSISICTNGYICIGGSSTSYTVYTLPTASAPLGMVALFWHDMNGSGITYGTVGSAPNRKFIINYNAYGDYSGGAPNTGQIVLYETSNIIEMYISQANTASGYSMVCGIQNPAGSAATTVPGQNNANYSINNTIAGTAWRFERPVYTYSWSPATGLSATNISNPVASGLGTSQTYSVTSVDGNSGCTVGNVTPLTVNVYTPPTAYTLAPATGCSAGTTITLPNSETGVNYQLYNGASTVGSPVAGTTGSSVSFGTITATGTYSVVATSSTGCSTNMTGTTVITASPNAYSITGGTGCASSGVTIGLSGSDPSPTTYQLYNGASAVGSPITGTGSALSWGTLYGAGSYSIVATTAAGCQTTMTGSSTIAVSPVAYSVTGGNGCSATGVTVGTTNSESGVSYQLYNGASAVGSPASGSTGSGVTFGLQTATGNYSVVATVGSCSVTMNGGDTISATPSISLGANPSVCQPISSTSISYSGATGSPTTYDITWGSTAIADGFTNVSGGTLSGGTIALVIPTGAANTYTGTITVSNGACTSSSYSFSVTVYAVPAGSITSAVVPCMGYSTSIVFSGTSGATVSYQINHGSIINATLTGGTYTLTTGAITAPTTYTLYDVHNPVCSDSINIDTVINPIPMQWVGGTTGVESEWNTTTNWSCGFIPTSADNVTIPSGTTYSPAIAASGSGTANSLTIAAGAQVTVGSGGVLNVKGNMTSSGSVKGAGTVVLNGTSGIQTISGNAVVNNFELNNAAGAQVSTASLLTIKGGLTVSSGNLATGDSVVLYSDSSATARVTALPVSGASISGNTKVMQYIPGGRRAFRFVSHPFSNNIGLDQVENYIDVTGAGGATNGFTTTASNAASAFRYNPLIANSAATSDPGWRPFTSAYALADSNKIHQYQGIRLFFRGAKGEGLYYATGYTPSPATIAQWGVLNQGPQTIPLAKGTGANQDYNMVGNPYASPVDIGTVLYDAKLAGAITGAAFYVWNPYLGSAGAFQTVSITTVTPTPYYIQANASFQVRAAYNTAPLNFTESHKGAAPSSSLLKVSPEYLALTIYDANYHPWDMLNIKFNDDATNEEDGNYDAGKPTNPDLNFYSISADNQKLAIDGRPYSADKTIPLGIESGVTQDFIIKAENVAVPAGGKVYLHDKLLKQYVLLQAGTEYRFTISSDKATQGKERFELSMSPANVVNNKGLQVTMSPNPATDEVTIGFTNGKAESVAVRVLDLAGVSVYNKDLGVKQNGSVSVQLSSFASGIYMVELTSGDQKVVQRLVKE